MKRSHVLVKAVLLSLIALSVYGCGGGSSGLNDNQGGATLLVTANPASIIADGISFSIITAVLTDNAGKPAQQGTQADFTTTLGYFANGANRFTTVTDTTGTAIAILYAGTLSGDAQVKCSAGGLVAYAPVKYTVGTPGAVANITLTASSSSIIADGISSSVITATLTDKNGTPVAIGTAAAFATNLAVFSNNKNSYSTTTVNESGTATATLIAGLTPGTATITCTSGSVSTIIKIEIRSF
jgi:adhesin/invasin